jgi:hypothetical protein
MRFVRGCLITMSKLLIGICLQVSLFALTAGETNAQRNKHFEREQLQFGAEVAVKRPVEVPQDVLSILREDKRNQTCLKEGESPASIPSSWFVGSRVHLKGDGDPDLVVSARNSCLFGANLVPFWIFRNTPHGYDLILSISALGLDILETRTRGYRDIRASAATATTTQTIIFKFGGDEYRVHKRATTTSRL